MKVKYKNSPRKAYHTAQCASCIFEVANNYYILAKKCVQAVQKEENKEREEKQAQLEDSQKMLRKLESAFEPDRSPNEIANELFLYAVELGAQFQRFPHIDYEIKKKLKQCAVDPWKEIRTHSNQVALEVVPIAEKKIQRQKNPKDRLYTAIEWSIVGNTIDYGTAGHDVELGKETLLKNYDEVSNEGFKINDFGKLFNELNERERCVYILDNAGEIAFDALVIKELIGKGMEVVAAVKGAPISNDAVMEDAIQVGLPEICEVITTGSADLGFHPKNNSQEFLDLLSNVGLVLAKGQANWEATYAYQHSLPCHIVFYNLLKIKCDVHAHLLGYPKGSNFIMRTTPQRFTT